MAGIKINSSESWVVATWVHSFTVRLLLRHWPPSASEDLRKTLRLDEDSGLGFFSIEQLEPQSLKDLLAAVELISRKVETGEDNFEDQAILPSYLERLKELRDLLARDPRLQSPNWQ